LRFATLAETRWRRPFGKGARIASQGRHGGAREVRHAQIAELTVIRELQARYMNTASAPGTLVAAHTQVPPGIIAL
jgi:hypothetical protein